MAQDAQLDTTPIDPVVLLGHGGEVRLRAVEEAMADVIGAEPGPLTVIAAEHVSVGGKRLRARLALAAGEALGAPQADTVWWAAAVESVHEASLIHDDLQDGDTVRRGHPTTWVRHGAAQAINAGDLLLLLPFMALRHIGTQYARAELPPLLALAATRMARGQSEEPFLLEHCAAVPAESRRAYRSCIEKKTGALFGVPVAGAAILAGRTRAEADALCAAFVEVGVLFQVVDDVLDLWGDKGRDKRGNDIREGKVSALVVEHLAREPEDAEWLCAVLRCPREETTDEDVAAVAAAFEVSGAKAGLLHQIEKSAEAVQTNAVLTMYPRLRPVVAALVERTLGPIAHLMPVGSAS